MRIFNLFLLAVLMVPFLFVVGIAASSADTLGPVSVGGYYINFNNVARVGERLKAATEGLAIKEVDIVRKIICNTGSLRPIEIDETVRRVKMIAQRNA